MAKIVIGDTYVDEWCNFIFVVQIKNDSIDVLYSAFSEAVPTQGKIIHYNSEEEFRLKLYIEGFTWKFITKVDGWIEYHRSKLVNSIKGDI
jgi:hypothetical protein